MAAAVSGQPAGEGAAGAAEREAAWPVAFRRAVQALRSAHLRAEVQIEDAPAPRRLARHAYALTASVLADGEELADGRLVLLHEPQGHKAWQGTFRVVTLTRAELEPEMAADPLLPEVAWSWLVDALSQRGAEQVEASGSVTRAGTQYFGSIADRPSSTEIELRASWTPVDERLERHLAAWCDLLCSCAGLPPAPSAPPASGGPAPAQPPQGPQGAQGSGAAPAGPAGGVGGVVPMPARRRPRH